MQIQFNKAFLYGVVPLTLILFMGFSACQQSPKADTENLGEEPKTTVLKPSPPFAQAHRQILLVMTEDWEAVQGQLIRFQWEAGKWKEIGGRLPIVVGKNGMAWGKGTDWLDDISLAEGPTKREGDRKSPAGIFTLTTAFGYASEAQASFIKLPYHPITPHTQCIEDVHSQYYNRIVSDTQPDKDWNSTDHMLRKDDLYEWGIEVAHNYEAPLPGGGSCIFIHIGNTKSGHTAGCTALEKEDIRQVLSWLDPTLSPALVQMPQLAYPNVRDALTLPQL